MTKFCSTPAWCFLQRMDQKAWWWKIDPGDQVNTIPLSRYWKIFPHKISESKYPKEGTLIPLNHSWISHDGKPQPFLGHFIANVNHATWPRSYPMQFYVFKDATSLQILLSCAMSKHLGILEFKVPNLTVQSHIDAITIPNSPSPGDLRKTAKCVTFWDPLISLPWCTFHPCGTPPNGLMMTAKTVQFREPISSYINNTKPKTPSHSSSKLLIPALKPKKPHPPIIKRHFHPLQWPRTSLLEVSFPQLVPYYRQHV